MKPASTSARLLGFAAAVQLGLALIMPALYQALLHLPKQEMQVVRWSFGALVPLVALVALVTLLFGLRGIDRDRAARGRVLALPARLALAVLGCGLLALAAMLAGLWVAGAPPAQVVGAGLCTAAVLAVVPVPLYALSRVLLLPVALALGDERPPEGRRLPLSALLGYSIFAVAAAALVPAAVFGAAQLDSASAQDARARAQMTGLRLAAAAESLDVSRATTLLTRTPLAGGERTLFLAPSGTMLPEGLAAELAAEPFVEIPLSGALRGGVLRVTYQTRPIARAPLYVVTLALLLLALAVTASAGASVARDLRRVTRQIDRVARGEEPGPLGAITTVEVARLTRAVNRLLDRVPRFTVESFLAIERAEEAQRLKSRFLANMSHDLRSPLNSILGFSELLLRGIEGEITDSQRAELALVQERGHQLLRLLIEILDTAKLESGKMELHRQSVPPAEILRAAMQEARRGRPQAVGDRLAVALQPGLLPLHVDPLRVTQAITHLLNYALDAMQGGRVTLRAHEAHATQLVPPARAFIVELEHEGEIGLEESLNLFDGFRKVAGKRGLHLQLPLARRLAELHGGALELTARAPARLMLLIPLARPS
ncbi:MAG TPA: HAMP domain-containing sensor histidine kinase [Polyangia bacterium]